MNTIKDFSIEGKRVLIRCDFNTPLDDKGTIVDDFRVQKSLPTIQYAMEQGARVILMAHLGKPHGKVVEGLRMDVIKDRLGELLGKPVKKVNDCVGSVVEREAQHLQNGEVLLLENLRFYEEEEENDAQFAKELASLADIYIDDAFGTAHRSHASIVGVPQYLPSGIGLLFEKELEMLSAVAKDPKKPLVMVMGGSKVKTKLRFINRISDNADWVLLGNLLANEATEQEVEFKHKDKIVMPPDGVLADGKQLDIGPATRQLFKEKIDSAATIFWNGPLGMTEDQKYREGSKEVAQAITQSNAFSVVGGGNLVAFLGQEHLRDKFSHVSTGGGSMIAFLAGDELPALVAIQKSESK